MSHQASVELPRWKSHKEVFADKIVEIQDRGDDPRREAHESRWVWITASGARIVVDHGLIARDAPVVGDYFVQYDDGYKSWSPAKAFEEGYTQLVKPIPPRVITHHIVPGDSANHQLHIHVLDKPGSGGANHQYGISFQQPGAELPTLMGMVNFQNGPIKEAGINGVTHEVLLAILIDRIEGFQAGPFENEDNQIALDHMRGALEALQRRTKARIARGVEGTHQV